MSCAPRAEKRAAYDALPAVQTSGTPGYQYVQLKTRPWVLQRFALSMPSDPMAVAIYFRGGEGLGGTMAFDYMLGRHGIVFAIVDPPSDKPHGFIIGGARSGAEHVADVDAVIRYLRQETALPVWLIGHSLGSVSVANVATRSTEAIDGVVFLSPLTYLEPGRSHPYGDWLVTEFPLRRIQIPVLAITHASDPCRTTPPWGAAMIVRQATHAPVKVSKLIDGGFDDTSDPCTGNGYHTFAGTRPEVADAIAAFIRENTRFTPPPQR